MAQGIRNFIGSVPQTDTAELLAYLRINGQPVTEDHIVSVNFIVQKPDGTMSTVPGTIQTDGAGFYRWTDTAQTGEYLVQAQFTLDTGEIRSVMTDFAVFDPFNVEPPTGMDLLIEQVMIRLEDAFDSVEGGPWLRDQTEAHFDYNKIASFVDEALLDINVQMPPTNYTIDNFTMLVNNLPNPNMPLLVKGVLVLIIRHLVRSYVEQPVPQGGQVVWEDRTRYTQTWQQVYQTEYQDFIQAVRLWKRTGLALGHSALLTSSKAGRLVPYGSMRTRGVYRGYY